MCLLDSETSLRSGLALEEIEERLVASARRHHLEERNVAYWLHEVATRSLYQKRAFASIGDYASELIDMKPRKAQYLVFIASRLASLPAIGAAFDSGELSWTKAREIVRVATRETEQEWLELAKRLSSRELEKRVRVLEGRESGGFVTLTISLPVELFSMWNDCHALIERLSGSEVERFQVLEPMMAEFLSTHVPAEYEDSRSPHETEDETATPSDIRRAVLERDGYRCTVPGCSMRKNFDVHHLEFRSHGGGHDPANLTTICRVHHGLIHRGICRLTGTAPDGLTFERPQLFIEKKSEPKTIPVAAIPDSPEPGPPPADRTEGRDPFREFIEHELRRRREDRAHARRRSLETPRALDRSSAHVFAGPLGGPDAANSGESLGTGSQLGGWPGG